jgi:flavin reductase (DIM6/NTAB) family NADH-FMN oxidoreductase RutF
METANIITIAWAGVVNSNPPMVGVSMRKETHSYGLLKSHGEFTVNIPHEGMLREVDVCGVVSGSEVDKFSYAHLTKLPSEKVKAPIIDEAIINLECSVRQVLELGSHTLFIGEVVHVRVDDKVLDDEGRVSIEKLTPFVYCPLIHEYRSIGGKLEKFGFSRGKTGD